MPIEITRAGRLCPMADVALRSMRWISRPRIKRQGLRLANCRPDKIRVTGDSAGN